MQVLSVSTDFLLLFVLSDVLPQVLMALVVVALIVFLWFQIRYGKLLKNELATLAKTKKHNVEYEFVLETMRLSIWHLDVKTMEITFEHDYREKGERYFTNVDGMTIGDSVQAIDPHDAERVGKALNDLCEGRINYYHEIYKVPIAYNNTHYWEESYATVVERDVEGKPSKIIGTTMRADDRKNMEEALVQARYRAEESDRLKSAFIANMSHEIRTPLNAIVGFTSLLPDIEDSAERKSLLDLIHENTQKLLRIVDDVVNISKIESGQSELMMTSFDLNMLLEEEVSQSQKDVVSGVTMTTAFERESLLLTTDYSRLKEIIKHLLSNAVKFTSQGSIEVGYSLHIEGRVQIFVRDTGKGIAEENLERVFDRFYKVDEYIPGAGLGLSLCRVLAFSLGGNVTVTSRLGEGSTFFVELPLR